MALTKRQAHGDLPDPLRERPGIVSTVHSRPASLDTRARHALLDKHRGPRAHTLSCRMSRTFPRKQESPSTPHSLDRTSLACSSRLSLLGSGGPDALPPRPVFLIRPSLCVLPITRVWCFCQQRLGSLGALPARPEPLLGGPQRRVHLSHLRFDRVAGPETGLGLQDAPAVHFLQLVGATNTRLLRALLCRAGQEAWRIRATRTARRDPLAERLRWTRFAHSGPPQCVNGNRQRMGRVPRLALPTGTSLRLSGPLPS